jgi:hypothetical protein
MIYGLRRIALGGSLIVASVALAACSAQPAATQAPHETHQKTPLGLVTSLPIYWAEAPEFTDMLGEGGAPEHWVRAALETRHVLDPIDALNAETLAGHDRLILAQPRTFAAAENVALDDWAAKGGRALIFADPLLTEHSEFAFGDKRRPQGAALMSPILARWGLELTFDDAQTADWRVNESFGISVPVKLSGAFGLIDNRSDRAACIISESGLIARCTIGEGSVVIVADAAVLETGAGEHGHSHDIDHGAAPEPSDNQASALQDLLELAFAANQTIP